ncbi:MAG: hypothetical protein EOO20_11755 [Chryseobacterium sp.]|nr:MAG: hypothetical protein EOO20_11755 [Chryseobacterium sp.]
MARRPTTNKEKLLVHLIAIRVSVATVKRLEKILSQSSLQEPGLCSTETVKGSTAFIEKFREL